MYLPDKNLMPTPAVVTHAAFSLESLVAWLETMPAETSYQWECTDGTCLIGQYSAAHGSGNIPYYEQTDKFRAQGPRVYIHGTDMCVSVAEATIACSHPRNFGAALQRARSYLASEVQS